MKDVHHVAAADLNLLVVLDELLRTRSTTLAARRLGRTQSAVSHALSRLRDTFADPLFVRAGATLRPTHVAESLATPVRELLERAETLLSRSNEAFDPKRIERTFVLAGTDYAEMLILPRLIPILRREAPGIDLVTRFLGDEVERAIQAREVDVAFGARLRALSGVARDDVRTDPMVVVLRRGHPATRRRLTPESFAALDHVLVTPRGLPGSAMDSALESLGLSRRVVLRLPHFAAAAHVVARTDLVVMMPAGFAELVRRDAGLVTLATPVPIAAFTFAIAYAAAAENDPAHRWFRQQVVAIGRSLPARPRAETR